MGAGKIAGYIFTVVIPVVVAAMLPHIGPEIGFPVILVSVVIGFVDFAWMYSKSHHEKPQMLLISGMAIGALLLGGSAIAFFVTPTKPKNIASIPPETERLVSQAQFAKVEELEKFLGGKDENDLRQLFDLQNILQKNINTQIIRISFIKAGKEKDFLYSNYTDNGSWIMWAKEGHYSIGPSGVHVDAGPKDVLHLVTTNKFQMAQKKLVEFMNSALVPEPVKYEVSKFNDLIHHDTEIMMHIMDARMHQDENYFIENMEMGTPFYGVIVNDYARAITPLHPAAGKVLKAISELWKISK